MNLAFDKLGLPGPTRARVLGVVGLSLPEAFQVLAPSESEATRGALAEAYKGAFPHAAGTIVPRDTLYPGARAVIEALAQRDDVLLGMATGKSRRGVARLMDQETWHAHFVTIQTADTNPSKPHPAMIETAMREAGVGPERTVIVGDTTYDIEMGRNAGVATIGVGWGYHDVELLQSAGADRIIHRFDALEAVLEQVLTASPATGRAGGP